MSDPKSIDVHALKKLRDENPELCIIDVREQDEWDALHIPNSLHISKDNLAAQIDQHVSDKNQAIYLHCQGGTRSSMAAAVLGGLGYTDVYNVVGGLREWAKHDYPTV